MYSSKICRCWQWAEERCLLRGQRPMAKHSQLANTSSVNKIVVCKRKGDVRNKNSRIKCWVHSNIMNMRNADFGVLSRHTWIKSKKNTESIRKRDNRFFILWCTLEKVLGNNVTLWSQHGPRQKSSQASCWGTSFIDWGGYRMLLIKQVQQSYRPASDFSTAGIKDMSLRAEGCCW